MVDVIANFFGGYEATKGLINQIVMLIAIMCLCVSVFLAYYFYKEIQKENEIYKIDRVKKQKQNIITDVWFKKLTDNLRVIELDRNKKEGWAQNVSLGIVAMLFASAIFMLSNKQIFIGIAGPLILLVVLTKITGLMCESMADKIKDELPSAIDAIIRSMSKSDDLPSILFDASSTIEDPLQSMFAKMSTKMLSTNPEKVINDFIEQNKSIWVYALSFTLLNYTENASKDDTVTQLRKLKSVIDKQNRDKNANKAEKKMTVAVNYVLCVFAILALFGNLSFNTMAKPFFFNSVGGIACFLVGVTLVIISVFSNLLLGKGKM